jgi:hypothetical protein
LPSQNFDVSFTNSNVYFYYDRFGRKITIPLTLRLYVTTRDFPGSNQSIVDWSLSVISGGTYAFNNNQNRWNVRINGVHYTGTSGWNTNNASRTSTFASNSTTVTHGANGESTIGVSFDYDDWKVVSGSGNFPLSNYNRSANAPSLTEVTRTSASNFRVSYSLSGSVNGPTTYVVQRSTTSDFSSGVTDYINPARPFDITSDANTTYWFRIYAYGDEGGNKFSGTSGPYYGQPTAPSIRTPSQITNSQKRISVPFSEPGYTGSGITSYTITRSGTPAATFTGITASPYIDTDTNLIPGNSYTYTVTALTSGYASNASGSSAAVTASGPPYAPTAPPTFTVNGLDITVTSAAVSGNGGVAIDTSNTNQGYYVQYQTSTTLDGTYGFGGVNGAWSTPVKMSNQSQRQHTYLSLTPALFYKFRTYAANSVIFDRNSSTRLYYPHNNVSYTANFATTSTGYFLAAGGKRWTGTAWVPTAIAKRWDPSLNSGLGGWRNLTIAKRWDASLNNGLGGWKNLS